MQITEAFQYFQFNKDEIQTFRNNIKQSEKDLTVKYRHFAKLYHPDRNGGSHAKFLELKGFLNCDTSKNAVDKFVNDILAVATGN